MNGIQENLKLEFAQNAKVPIGIEKERKIKKMKNISIQYIAGYIDGEGSITIYPKKDRPNPMFSVQASNTHLPTIKLIHQYFGVGNIHKLKTPLTGRKPYYQWCAGARLDVIFVLEHLLPYLIEKKERAKKVLKEAKRLTGMRYVRKGCDIKNCSNKHFAKGYCQKHYYPYHEKIYRKRNYK